jgi:sugar O-acyltransferase (sialic acid O-acetyltransferase NeuD family)
MSGITVVGGGGHAKVVLALCKAAGITVDRVVDDDLAKDGSTLLGVPVCAPIRDHLPRGARAVIAIGNNAARERVARDLDDLVGQWVTLIHPRAYVDPSVKVGVGSVVFAGAVVQVDSVIGAHVIINTGATVDHDAVIGDVAHLAPGVHLAGSVTIGEGAFLGVGVAVIPGRTIGPRSVVGAGAAVVADIDADVVAVGVPARVTRRLG